MAHTALALGLWACSAEHADAERPVVVVSVLPQAWFVERLAGDRVQVEVMIPPGASPATHQPTMLQLRALSRADLYVKVGHPNFPFEAAWLDHILAENADLVVVDGSAGIADVDVDPHVWLAPRNARPLVGAIAASLASLLPDARDALDANRARLLAEIDALDAELGARFAPLRGGRFLVFHPAWGHLAAAYGLEQVAIEEEGKPLQARRLTLLIERARALGIAVVFAQAQFDPTGALVIASEIGARVETLDPLAYDWSDNLRSASRALASGVVP